MYGGIRGCKTIPEVGVAIRLPESKMAAKMAAQMKQTLKTFSMQYAQLSVDIQLYHIACIVQWSDSYCWTSLGVAPRNDAYADVVSWVHRDADEGIMCGYAGHCSLPGSR